MSRRLPLALLGLQARILLSKDASMTAFSGKVVLETKNTLVISTEKGCRVVSKKVADFEFRDNAGEVRKVSGESLIGRPEERIARVG